VRNVRELPPLTEAVILKWADAHYARNGTWPNETSGAIVSTARRKVVNVNAALSQGLRGLPGGTVDLAVPVLKAALPCPHLSAQQAIAIIDYHLERNQIAKK
jgi:hypothetical protein